MLDDSRAGAAHDECRQGGDVHRRRAVTAGADGVEIYTGAYAAAFHTGHHQPILDRIAATASRARDAGLVVNAGHDLNLHNIPPLMRAVLFLAEASIAHELSAEQRQNGFPATGEG